MTGEQSDVSQVCSTESIESSCSCLRPLPPLASITVLLRLLLKNTMTVLMEGGTNGAVSRHQNI